MALASQDWIRLGSAVIQFGSSLESICYVVVCSFVEDERDCDAVRCYIHVISEFLWREFVH